MALSLATTCLWYEPQHFYQHIKYQKIQICQKRRPQGSADVSDVKMVPGTKGQQEVISGTETAQMITIASFTPVATVLPKKHFATRPQT